MLIEIHIIQNHSPANLNRDDLGAPKTCYFGGVLRSRISSQCIKRSIRMSDEFKLLLGGNRTRRLPEKLNEIANIDILEHATKVMQDLGLYHKDKEDDKKDNKKDIIVFLSRKATEKIAKELEKLPEKPTKKEFSECEEIVAELIAKETDAPDIALSGRMLEPASSADVWKKLKSKKIDRNVEASLQVSHAISTHTMNSEVDYFIAADDLPGEDAGGAHIGESQYNSACFYKYFSIDWEELVKNLQGFGDGYRELAAHTVGAFLMGAAKVNPTGKQNSYAAHNLPDGILIEIKEGTPTNYANAFVDPAEKGERDIVDQSTAQLGQYIHDLDVGYGEPAKRFWFSPNMRFPLTYRDKDDGKDIDNPITENNLKSLNELVPVLINELGFDWDEVRKVTAVPMEES